MKSPKDITARLHEKADRDCRAFVDAQLKPIFEKWNQLGGAHGTGVSDGQVSTANRKSPHWWGEDWVDLKSAAEQALMPLYREQAVANFMATVESLSAQVGELTQAVEHIENQNR